MAELAAAGSIVGLLSLGIQSCQGLASYCSAWSSYNQQIRGTQRIFEELQITCEILRRELSKISQREKPVGQQVVRIIESCEEGIKSLHDAWRKCQPDQVSSNLVAKAKLQCTRALYPFKDQTLRVIKRNVRNLQANLGCALQVLQLYITFPWREPEPC